MMIMTKPTTIFFSLLALWFLTTGAATDNYWEHDDTRVLQGKGKGKGASSSTKSTKSAASKGTKSFGVGKGTKSFGKGTKSVGKGTKSMGKGTKSVGKGTKSVGKGTKSMGKGTKSMGKGKGKGNAPSKGKGGGIPSPSPEPKPSPSPEPKASPSPAPTSGEQCVCEEVSFFVDRQVAANGTQPNAVGSVVYYEIRNEEGIIVGHHSAVVTDIIFSGEAQELLDCVVTGSFVLSDGEQSPTTQISYTGTCTATLYSIVGGTGEYACVEGVMSLVDDSNSRDLEYVLRLCSCGPCGEFV